MNDAFFQSTLFSWVIVPLLIFIARILDVSLQTIRIIAISRNIRWLAPIVGFFEVFIWLVAIGQIMKNYSHILTYVAYASGFATGTYIGMLITEKMSLGMVLIRIISSNGTSELKAQLRTHQFGYTTIPGQGAEGPVEILFTVVKRHKLELILNVIKAVAPKAFYSVEEVAQARSMLYPLPNNVSSPGKRSLLKGLSINRK